MGLTANDIAAWPLTQVRDEMRRRKHDVASLREKNGGTLVGIKGADAEAVKEHMQTLNDVLGPRNDELMEQSSMDDSFTKLSSYMDDPAEPHPGHGKGGRGANGRPAKQDGPNDIGGRFVESDAWKSYRENGTLNREVSVPLASLFPGYRGIGETPGVERQAALFDSGGFPTPPDFIPTPVETLFQPNNIGPLMAQGTTQKASIRYPVETVTAIGAAETAEGDTKPEANLDFSPVDEPVRKIAVLLPLTDEALEDNDFLRAYINARLGAFVRMREDAQLLGGDGTGVNLVGLLNRSGINTSASYSIGGSTPAQALIDAFFMAQMAVEDAFLNADAQVMKPSTWAIARLAKDTVGNYLLGPASDAAPNRLWGLRVVLNANMPAQAATNKVGLVGAFQTAAMIIRRSGIDLAVSDSHSTFFAENKVALRAEERLALAVFRPAGFAAVTSAV